MIVLTILYLTFWTDLVIQSVSDSCKSSYYNLSLECVPLYIIPLTFVVPLLTFSICMSKDLDRYPGTPFRYPYGRRLVEFHIPLEPWTSCPLFLNQVHSETQVERNERRPPPSHKLMIGKVLVQKSLGRTERVSLMTICSLVCTHSDGPCGRLLRCLDCCFVCRI